MNDAVRAWDRFWFTPRSTATLGLVRMAGGLIALIWALSLAPDLQAFYGEDGLVAHLPHFPNDRWIWGLLQDSPSFAWVLLIWGLLVAGAVALVVGWHSRLAALVTWVAMLSLQRRSPFILNSGDVLVRLLLLYLVLAPSGAAFSLDRRRRCPDDPWSVEHRAPFALRLVQVQLCVVYVATVWAKVRGTTWNDGTAVSYALRIGDLTIIDVPTALSTSKLFSNVATWGALAVEVLVPILIWNRRARPWVIAAGLVLHLSIELTLMVGLFSFAIAACYLAFTPPEAAERFVLRLRRAGARRRRRAAPTPTTLVAPGDPPVSAAVLVPTGSPTPPHDPSPHPGRAPEPVTSPLASRSPLASASASAPPEPEPVTPTPA